MNNNKSLFTKTISRYPSLCSVCFKTNHQIQNGVGVLGVGASRKEKNMKRIFIPMSKVVLCLCTALLITSTACGNTRLDTETGWPKPKKKLVVNYDAAVAQRLTDTVATLLFSANKATVYRINPKVNPKDKDKTIGGIRIEEKIGTMEARELQTIQFLLADSCCYSDTPVIPITPFSPSIALEMSSKQGSVCLLFSFASQEVGVVIDGEVQKEHRYSYARLITRLFENYLDKEYYKYLMTLIL